MADFEEAVFVKDSNGQTTIRLSQNGHVVVGGPETDGRVLVTDHDGANVIALNGGSNEITVKGRIFLQDMDGKTTVTLNGGAKGRIALQDSDGETNVTLDGNGSITAQNFLVDGPATGSFTEVLPALGQVAFGGGGRAANVLVRDEEGAASIRLSAGEATLGSEGHPGKVEMRDDAGLSTIVLNGRNGGITLGGDSQDGDLIIKDRFGSDSVRIDGASGEIRIKNWSISVPDYVFADDYDLRSLDDVRDFVADNQHLPDIASSSDFADDGVPVSHMMLDLLRKVEELTLYLIEKHDQVRRLEQRIATLEQPDG